MAETDTPPDAPTRRALAPELRCENPPGAPMNLPRTPMGSASSGRPVDPPRRPVLLVNPRSGGSKAARAAAARINYLIKPGMYYQC